MKKIAIFVEGETELEFVSQFLLELAGQNNITINQYKYKGGGRNIPQRIAYFTGNIPASDEKFQANIYVSSKDESVNTDIKEQAETLYQSGFERVIGLRDLRGQKPDGQPFRLTDLPRIELANTFVEAQCQPLQAKIIIAVMEIETWFLAETTHYAHIGRILTENYVKGKVGELGFNPYDDNIDALTKIAEPTEALKAVYQLATRDYSKKKKTRLRTINRLDYANLYLHTRHRLTKLDDFITELDDFSFCINKIMGRLSFRNRRCAWVNSANKPPHAPPPVAAYQASASFDK